MGKNVTRTNQFKEKHLKMSKKVEELEGSSSNWLALAESFLHNLSEHAFPIRNSYIYWSYIYYSYNRLPALFRLKKVLFIEVNGKIMLTLLSV